MGHLKVVNIGDVNIGYVGPCISGPAPALVEVPLQNDDDNGDEGDDDENDDGVDDLNNE